VRPSDDGSVVVIVALLLATTTLLASVLAIGARGVIDSERAAIAADAAALAGILQGESFARIAAESNGATSIVVVDDTVESGTFGVRVRVGRSEASATAADRWFPPLPTLR